MGLDRVCSRLLRMGCPLHERLDCTHHEHAALLSEPVMAHDKDDLILQATKLYRVRLL